MIGTVLKFVGKGLVLDCGAAGDDFGEVFSALADFVCPDWSAFPLPAACAHNPGAAAKQQPKTSANRNTGFTRSFLNPFNDRMRTIRCLHITLP